MTTPNSELLNDPAVPPSIMHENPPPKSPKAWSGSDIYGSFWIDETELAIPVSAIREVVNQPDAISRVPLAPDFLSGLFNLRGMIIPIIDLRILLEFPEYDVGQELERKVAIIENGNKCIGLLFDSAGEVLNELNSPRLDFAEKKNGGTKDVVIDGVLKLDGGNRMVQIINPYEVLNIEQIPQAKATEFESGQQNVLGSRLSCVSFQAGHTSCAIDLRYIQEVREMPPVEGSLLANGYVIGTANLRGETIPVIDFRSYMGNEDAYKLPKSTMATRKMLVVTTPGGLVGLMVYSIDSIVPFFERDIRPFADLALLRGNVVKGCLIDDENQIIMLLDHERLLSDPGLVDSARICQEVHEVEGSPEQSKKSLAAERRTFIIFTASNRFAMDTCAVSEVINKPEKLLKPPYALRFVEGIINLRGELITLVNLREMYGLESCETSDEKVVIFFHKARKYAILVDGVDEIIMTTSDKVSNGSALGLTQESAVASKDVAGVLQVSGTDDKDSLVMIMCPDALVERLANEASALGVDAEAEFAAQ